MTHIASASTQELAIRREPAVLSRVASLQALAGAAVLRASADDFCYEAALSHPAICESASSATVLKTLAPRLQARAVVVNRAARDKLLVVHASAAHGRSEVDTFLAMARQMGRLLAIDDALRAERRTMPAPAETVEQALCEAERRLHGTLGTWHPWPQLVELFERPEHRWPLTRFLAQDTPARDALTWAHLKGAAPTAESVGAATRHFCPLVRQLPAAAGPSCSTVAAAGHYVLVLALRSLRLVSDAQASPSPATTAQERANALSAVGGVCRGLLTNVRRSLGALVASHAELDAALQDLDKLAYYAARDAQDLRAGRFGAKQIGY